MDSLSVAGATTVIGDLEDSGIYSKADTYRKRQPSSSVTRGPAPQRFGDNLDYMSEKRQYFVRIGAGGLLAALEQLDRELVEVRQALEKSTRYRPNVRR